MQTARTVNIFKGSVKTDTYLFLPADSDPASLPDALLRSMGELVEVMTLEIAPDRKLARAKTTEVLEAIDRQGFYLQLPPRHDAPMANDRLTY